MRAVPRKNLGNNFKLKVSEDKKEQQLLNMCLKNPNLLLMMTALDLGLKQEV